MAHTADRDWSELAQEALAGIGGRRGAAREVVVRLLAGQDCCLSAAEIADASSAGGSRVGLASVYRTLELLRGAGLVQAVEVGDGQTRYEAVTGWHHHHHVVCERCGGITPFEDPGLERAMRRLADRLRYRVSGHDVLLRGTCGRCATSR